MDSIHLKTPDWIIIVLYFLTCLSIGIYTKLKQKKHTAEEYFLAGRSMVWFVVGSSLYASNIGAEHFVGLAGSGASTGVAVTMFEWQSSWIILLLGFLFVPIYMRSGVYTMPEYLRRRFQSKWIRTYLTTVCLINYIITKIAVDIYAGSLFLKEAVNLNMYLSAFVLLGFTATYTLLGGLSAVIYTDFIQCTIMLIGGTALSIIGFNQVGGFDGLWRKYPQAVGNTTALLSFNSTLIANHHNSTSLCYKVEENWDRIFRPLDDKNFPWIGVVFTIPMTSIWYWCTDQLIVQRVLGAKNLAHAQGGTVMAAFLKLLPFFIMVTPGMIARVLFPDLVACPDYDSCFAQCGNGFGCTNHAYPKLVLSILPTGVVGLMLSVMVAAVMSSMSSAFNSASTIFTMDIWKVLRPKAADRELLWVGRVVIVILVGIGVAWIPIVESGGKGQLLIYYQSIQSYLSPPTAAVFLLGLLWPNLTEVGALSSMLLGLCLGIIRFLIDVTHVRPHCGEVDTRPFFARVHFLYYALFVFVVCLVTMVVISKFTKPVPLNQLGRLTWKTIDEPRFDDNAVITENNRAVDGVPLAEIPLNAAENSEGEVKVKVVEAFKERTNLEKWILRVFALLLLIMLLSMFIWMG